eukprot:355364-Chlamydomonas_euryale.AAC.6
MAAADADADQSFWKESETDHSHYVKEMGRLWTPAGWLHAPQVQSPAVLSPARSITSQLPIRGNQVAWMRPGLSTHCSHNASPARLCCRQPCLRFLKPAWQGAVQDGAVGIVCGKHVSCLVHGGKLFQTQEHAGGRPLCSQGLDGPCHAGCYFVHLFSLHAQVLRTGLEGAESGPA